MTQTPVHGHDGEPNLDDTSTDSMDDLQFERAETPIDSDAEVDAEQEPQIGCTFCKQAIDDVYFTVNDRVFCQTCRDRELAHRTGGTAGGRAFKALVFGTIAGGIGASIYYGVLVVTGYEIGLISIAVGFLVGFAVNLGSHQRGGWFYQLMAMGLTYLAIVSTYIPIAAEELRSQPVDGAEMTGVFFWIVVVIISFLGPFLAGLDNFLGLLIIGFGIYQAWSLNRRVAFDEEGPFRLIEDESKVHDPLPLEVVGGGLDAARLPIGDPMAPQAPILEPSTSSPALPPVPHDRES